MIDIVNLSKTIGPAVVLDNISLTLPSGRINALVGPNGSGKTMLMRAIAGLIRPSRGYVEIDGKRIGHDMAFPPSLGLMLEGPTFLDGYTGLKNLQLLASIRKIADDATVRSWIARVGLDPDDRRKYRKYSLGMKQRLGIAGAFMETPDILLLDEPTNALDSDGVNLFAGLAREARQRGATVILACHDAAVLQSLADEAWTFKDGRVVAHETPPIARQDG